MPEVSRFLGIVVTMYFNDHNPPHFHVRYGEYRATINIETVQVQEGELPSRVRDLVVEWGRMHGDELRENWTLLATQGKLKPIPPLV
jgi:hypothetical protein